VVCRCIQPIYLHMTLKPRAGSHTLTSRTCNSSSLCSTLTSVLRFLQLPGSQGSTKSSSAHPTGTAYSNLSSTGDEKGTCILISILQMSLTDLPNVVRFSFLQTATTVPVVPPRHDQYPRFLSAAWPYYAGAISTSVGFFLFAALWLAGDVREKRKHRKTE